MLIPPPTLTQMERQLLQQIQSLAQTLLARVAEQDSKIAALATEVRARDQAISGLTDTLARLLGPPDPDGSSPR
jgi:uncharacterized protein YlxW (UPF0749 family)